MIYHIEGKPVRLTINIKNDEVQRQWDGILKVLKGKKQSAKNPAMLSFKSEGEIYSQILKRSFVVSRPDLTRNTQEVLQAELQGVIFLLIILQTLNISLNPNYRCL